MAETELTTPRRALVLRRPGTNAESPLRAWSAADELALAELGTEPVGRLLIVNDEFGALTCGLGESDPIIWGDSAVSRAAIEANLAANELPPLTPDRIVGGDEVPEGVFDTVIVRIPKTTAVLEHQLQAIAACSSPTTRVIGAGMTRHVHSSTVHAFETRVGETVTSRATRKARLIHSTPAADAATAAPAAPTVIDAQGLKVAELPGTFSAGHLDVGSALLINELTAMPAPRRDAMVADLGCGNGVLAAAAARQWPDVNLLLVDVSDLAIAAARLTAELNNFADRAEILAADGFAGVDDGAIDVVISNPPFHQGQSLDRELTDRLLADTARVLTADGVAYVVVQRHLQLHIKMKKWFRRVEVTSKHPTHVVIVAQDPR